MDDVRAEDADVRYLSFEEEAAAALDFLSDEMIEATEAMQSVATMSEPVLAEAIGHAREILRKLKVKFGAAHVLDELAVADYDTLDSLDELGFVARTFEHLLAWSRGLDASIMGDPSVQAAINSVGQLAFIVKMESLRLAKKSRDMFLADSIRQRMAMINAKFKAPSAKNLGEMLDKVERGINRVLSNVQDKGMSGAAISHTKKDVGAGLMHTAPTAGLERQSGAETQVRNDTAAKKQAEIQLAQESAMQAQAAQIASQNAARQRQQANQSVAPRGTGRQAIQQARATQRQQQQRAVLHALIQPKITAPANAQAMTNQMAQVASQHHEDELHRQQEQELQRAREAAARKAAEQAASRKAAERAAQEKATAAKIAAERAAAAKLAEAAQKTAAEKAAATQKPVGKIDANLLKGVDIKGFDMKQVTGAPVVTSAIEQLKQTMAMMDPSKPNPSLPPVNPAHKAGVTR